MKYIATTSDKMKDIPIVFGQIIFSKDDRIIYLDSDVRTSFQQIITLIDEDQRKHLISPVSGFYFIKENNNFWYYENDVWTLLTERKENLFFENKNSFPIKGTMNTLYIDKLEDKIYQWNDELQAYTKMNSQKWEEISL